MDSSRRGTYLCVSPMAAHWWAEIVIAREQGWTCRSERRDEELDGSPAGSVGRFEPIAAAGRQLLRQS